MSMFVYPLLEKIDEEIVRAEKTLAHCEETFERYRKLYDIAREDLDNANSYVRILKNSRDNIVRAEKALYGGK